jgi:hypothetical protein
MKKRKNLKKEWESKSKNFNKSILYYIINRGIDEVLNNL